MNKLLAFIFCYMICLQFGLSQSNSKAESADQSYTRTINTRAEKIVASLGISNTRQAELVQSIIATQYYNLNTIHTDRDLQIKAAKQQGDSKEATEAAIKKN